MPVPEPSRLAKVRSLTCECSTGRYPAGRKPLLLHAVVREILGDFLRDALRRG